MTDPARHTPLARAAARRRGDARQRTQQALQDLHRTGASISFAVVARAAEVSRKFLYSQPDLRDHIERARAAQADAPRSTVPLRERAADASVRARLRATLEENKRLRDDNADLPRARPPQGHLLVSRGSARTARTRRPTARALAGSGLMSALAPTLQAFFTERLTGQRHASPNTIAAYRDTHRLLLGFASRRLGRQPCELDIADLDAPLIAALLTHLETERGNSIRTRNARLAAIHSLYRYAQHRHPEHADDIQRVLAIPPKRAERALVTFLDREELEALLAAPDRSTWTGKRDHALLRTRSRPDCAPRS